MNNIFINQIGYTSEGTKHAYIYSKDVGMNTVFSLKDEKGNTVYTANISKPINDELAGGEVSCCNFSDFTKEGIYTISIGSEESDKLLIGSEYYSQLFQSVLKYFSLSRCGCEINDEENKLWSHEACHTSDAVIYGTDRTKKVIGGWHDAGDYGRYIVAGSKTVMDLLLAYDESKNSHIAFDILDEVKFELKWMLDMQREDGAVYHKISCYHFCGFIPPQNETDVQVLAPISTAATCDFAGCLSFASKYYEEIDSDFSQTLKTAALKALNYAETHNDELYNNPPEITTGCYGDWNVTDERYFALCSVFVMTKNKVYLDKAIQIRNEAKSKKEEFKEPWKKNWNEGFGWGSVAAYGTEILLKNADLIQDKEIIKDLQNGIIEKAEHLLSNSKKSGFGISLNHIFWGSNGAISDECHMLLLAYDITGKKEYLHVAEKNVDYILGCNPLNICYVTGNGINSPVNPHHRQSGFLKNVMPGMLAGGPSAGLQDDIAKNYLKDKAPLLCYIDHTGSYSTNEVAIYWNSPFAYTLAKLKLV